MILEGLRKLFARLVVVRFLNRWLIFFNDLVFSLVSTALVIGMISYAHGITFPIHVIVELFLCSILSSSVSFLICCTYKGVIRHSAFTETGRIAIASFIKVFLFAPLIFAVVRLPMQILLIAIIMDFILTFSLLTFIRTLLIISYRYITNFMTPTDGRMLIYCHEDEHVPSTVYGIYDKSATYHLDGFVQYKEVYTEFRIAGHPVYSFKSKPDFMSLASRRNVKAILFLDRKDLRMESERLVRYCEQLKIRMLMMPTAIDEVKDASFSFRYLPEVRIDDLLGREEIQINLSEISSSLKDKVVMVTGAAGSIGSEICRQLCRFGLKQLVLFDSAETPMHNIRLELEEKFPSVNFVPIVGDVRMEHRVENVFKRFHPQYLFHAAAYKHVPLMEENPCEAVHTNVYGTHILADMSVKYGVEKFVMISTDKAVNPTNVMGASKRLAEMYIQSLGLAISRGRHPGKTHFITTRFGNVLGSNGSVIPRFREQLAKGGPLTVTHPDIIRYFMTIPEACRLVLEAAFMGEGNDIFVFDMGEPVKIADLARRMIELSGLIPGEDIKIRYTGLRPGEKLYEELLVNKADTLPTSNGRIFRSPIREFDYDDVATVVQHLMKVAIDVDKHETVKMMKLIVPEFKSNNSEYEAIDIEIEKVKKVANGISVN